MCPPRADTFLIYTIIGNPGQRFAALTAPNSSASSRNVPGPVLASSLYRNISSICNSSLTECSEQLIQKVRTLSTLRKSHVVAICPVPAF